MRERHECRFGNSRAAPDAWESILRPTRLEGGDDARQAAADEAYRRCSAYWFPERWPAQIEYLGEQEEQGKRFYVIRITPKDCRPFDMWIAPSTYLIDHTVEKADIETRTNYFFEFEGNRRRSLATGDGEIRPRLLNALAQPSLQSPEQVTSVLSQHDSTG